MKKLNLLTYADDLYRPMQAKLIEHAQSLGAFDTIFTRTRNNLIETDFYKDNKYILDGNKGGGYCLWKPYYILEVLNRMEENDLLLYMDSADYIYEGDKLRETVFQLMKDKDLLLTDGAFPAYKYTKRDAFIQMGCDKPEYHNSIQLEAGIVLVKNTDFTRKIILEWLHWCKNPSVITFDENVCGLPNLEGFKEGRYDQAILSLLKYKLNLYSSGELRPFIHCNINMPE